MNVNYNTELVLTNNVVLLLIYNTELVLLLTNKLLVYNTELVLANNVTLMLTYNIIHFTHASM